MVWNHYINRRDVPAPFTKQIAEKIRPEGYNADHLGFGTILFTRFVIHFHHPTWRDDRMIP
jgi:hypothetical protein